MHCLVTGAAGFIGSHLCERLLQLGHFVTGIDALLPNYAPALKRANLDASWQSERFQFRALDLRTDALTPVLDGVEVLFHLAAMPGLPNSWTDFDLYVSCNLTATQRLLEGARRSRSLRRFVLASTSSVYGRYASGDESTAARPTSPYGVTKLAAENLCRAYAEEQGVPLVVLRYFSVYGPRQRPDMGYYHFIQALLRGTPITVFGDGRQARCNTFVTDCVAATVAATEAPHGATYNVAGGEAADVWEILRRLEHILGRRATIHQEPTRAGDQRSTQADCAKIQRDLGWQPRVPLDEGLARQVKWQAAALPCDSEGTTFVPPLGQFEPAKAPMVMRHRGNGTPSVRQRYFIGDG